MIKRFLDPTNDFAFKQIFGQERNKDILIHFLNDVLSHKDIGTIEEVEFLDPLQRPDITVSKVSIVDIHCRDDRGQRYIIEMQVASQDYFIKRAQFYAAKAYCSQMRRGGEYEGLKQVIFLAITDFEVLPKKRNYKTVHGIFDMETQEHDLKDFHFVFIQLPKFKKGLAELKTMEEKWCYFLKHADQTKGREYEQLVADAPIMKRAYDELDASNWTEEELSAYEKGEKDRRDESAILKTSHRQGKEEGIVEGMKKGMEKGIEQGMEKGIEQGMEKGIEQGMEKGREEGEAQKSLKIAKAMLQEGLSIETIARITGLSQEELKKLLPKPA